VLISPFLIISFQIITEIHINYLFSF